MTELVATKRLLLDAPGASSANIYTYATGIAGPELHMTGRNNNNNSPESFQVIVFEHLEHLLIGNLLRDSIVQVAEPENDVGLPKQHATEQSSIMSLYRIK